MNRVPTLSAGAGRTGPPSFAQQRLWFIHQMEPNLSAYHIVRALRLLGPLNQSALQGALQTVVARHEALRTRFGAVDGQPVQQVTDELEVDLACVEVAGGMDEAGRLARGRAEQPFCLELGPLFRFELFRLAPQDHLFLLVLHHLIGDGWSLGIIAREISADYAARVQGGRAVFPPLPLQYLDVIQRQRAAFDHGAMASALAYWREILAGCPTTLDLPSDYPRPAVQSFVGGRERVRLAASLTLALRNLGRREGVTVYAILLAAFEAVLARWSGQARFLVGAPVALRHRPEEQALVGFLINTLALRADLTGNPTVQELLKRTRTMVQGALAHQELPFEKLIEAAQPERSLSGNPLCQVFFALQNAPPAVFRLSGVEVTPVELEVETARFDLVLSLGLVGETVEGFIEYSTSLFAAETIRRFWGHFATILGGMVERPELRLSQLPLLSAAEREALLMAGNGHPALYPEDRPVHELVAEQARQRPAALAVATADGQLTYGQLNRRAESVAGQLRALGAGSERVVAVCCERSFDLVIGLLGVWKAGAAYLPLDPTCPEERLRFLVEDAQAVAVVTQRHLVPRFESVAVPLVVVGETPPEIGVASGSSGSEPTGTDTLAYVIYTSGSTGTPKGVAVTHRSLLNLIGWHRREYSISEQDRATQLAGLGFDASVWEIWPYLTAGASLWLVDEETRAWPESLRDWLVRHAITLCFLPTPLAEEILRLRWPEAVRLRALLTGGDRLRSWAPPDLPFALINHYGPTENAVVATCAVIGTSPGVGSPPIGRPLPNVHAYVLDGDLNMIPAGATGELYLGGVSLARGYHRRPEATAEAWVPDPFGSSPGGRLYRTGDLCRYRADGLLEFVGRRDGQVKVRGHRIELGEIETVLSQHPGVRQCAVMARDNGPGGRRLTAYVRTAEGAAFCLGEWRAHLRQRLPDYMVPATWTRMDQFPLNASGKIDRAALPEPEEPVEVEGDGVPRTACEQALARIWSDVLRLDRVGLRDNYFALGGDSILSIQIIARAAKAGWHLTPKQLFQHQTIEELARVAMSRHDSEPGLEPDLAAGADEIPLTPIQRWYFDLLPAEPHHFNQSLLLEVRRAISPDHLAQAIDAVVAHHDALRFRFRCEGGQWREFQVPHETAGVVSRVDLASLAVAEREGACERVVAEVHRSLDLGEGPLIHVAWFDFGVELPARLLIVVHHLVVDGVSWWILLDDLEGALDQIEAGQAVALPPKTTPFQTWARRLEHQARAPEWQVEWEFWEAQGARTGSGLPIDLAGESVDNTWGRAGCVSGRLSEAETAALLHEVCPRHRAAMNEVLLTALVRALGSPTEAQSLWVDLEGHGREDLFPGIDLSRTVGWFTSLYPLLLELPGGGLAEAINAVKERVRSVPHHGLGYGLLRHLNPETAVRLPPFSAPEVSFNYRGHEDLIWRDSKRFRGRSTSALAALGPRLRRAHLLDVSARLSEGCLSLDWYYSRAHHRRETVEAWAAALLDALRALIAESRSPGGVGAVPSDFPLARLDQATLDRVVGGDGLIEDLYPLTPLQQGMLFHLLDAPHAGLYTAQFVWELEGDLDRTAWERAWQHLIERQAIFRTRFVWQGAKEPLQAVLGRAPFQVAFEDWGDGIADAERGSRLAAFLQAELSRPFDLANPPLMRVTLLRIAEHRHLLVWVFHHLLLDGWCLNVVLDELLGAYGAFRRGAAPRNAPPPAYRDYLAWLTRQDTEEAETFWRAELRGFRAPTPLGFEPAGGVTGEPASGVDYGEVAGTLGAGTTARLQALARGNQLTLSTVLQGAWAVVLSRHSGEEEVLYGLTVSGRPPALPGVERMLGLFINGLPLRLAVPGREPLLPWLRWVQQRQVEVRQFEHLSLVQVQGWSEVPRGIPLFETLFVFENYAAELPTSRDQEGLRWRHRSSGSWTNYPVELVILPGNELILRIKHDRRRCGTDSAARLLRHLTSVLEAFADHPERCLDQFALEPPRPQPMPPAGFAGAEDLSGLRSETTISTRFARQVQATPSAPAICTDRERWSYEALGARVNAVARAVEAAAGVVPGHIALLFSPEPSMIAAMLGVLQGGHAYVPLDPSAPDDRLRYQLEDAAAAALLTSRTQVARAQRLATRGIRVIDVDELAIDPALPAVCRAEPDAPAYLLYTSGSTGRPKGICQVHRHVLHFIDAYRHGLSLVAADRLTLFASYAHDAAVVDIFSALLNGASLHLFDLAEAGLGPVADWLRRHRITVYHSVPTTYRRLAESFREGATFPDLRAAVLGGEAVYRADAELLGRMFGPGCRLVNLYGSTESTITSMFPVADAEPLARRALPIGRPLEGTEVFLLDRTGRPTEVLGEIAVRSRHVALGYWRQPELTASVFTADAWGGRLYRTGDVGRCLPNGQIEVVGRRDFQLKIRGFRVEPGEVEAVLSEHPALRGVAVVGRETKPGEIELVAYYAAREDGSISDAALREFLLARLPDYLIPTTWVRLTALPLTPSGKLDRRSLPGPEARPSASRREPIAPRTPSEIALAELWSEVLGKGGFDLRDDFFVHGGHSLRATQLVARVQDRFGVDLPLRRIFENPTIEALASAIDRLMAEAEADGAEWDELGEAGLRGESPGDATSPDTLRATDQRMAL
jgi:amino acid adenylation domain-containing protein/non-ribosomal peptide synthase protein (TIGR01720 family)